jgi:putative sterol carrier protein
MATSLTSVAELAALSPDEVERFFATEDAEVIVHLVDQAPDEELRRLVALAHVRDAAVHHVLHRLGEFAIPERLAKVNGVVEFVVNVPKGVAERHALVFDGHTVSVLEGDADADVTIETDILDFVRLVSGGMNAALMLLGNRMSVAGDEQLALAVGGVFQVPGRPGVAVDPAEVDPEQVAHLLKRVKDDHLRRVMRSGFRDVVLEQIFARFPDFLDERKAAGRSFSVGFVITGRADGGSERYAVHVADGTCRVGPDVKSVDAVITVSGADFLKLVTGNLNPVLGVMRGALKVRGDVTTALELHKIMQIPGQR